MPLPPHSSPSGSVILDSPRAEDLLEEPVEETLAPARDDERESLERRAERDVRLAVHDARVEIERRALPLQARAASPAEQDRRCLRREVEPDADAARGRRRRRGLREPDGDVPRSQDEANPVVEVRPGPDTEPDGVTETEEASDDVGDRDVDRDAG